MFIINIYVKLALIALCLIGGTILIFTTGFWYAFPFLLIGLILLVSYILLGTIQSAAQLVQQNDFIGAEQRLALTKWPQWLYVTNRAYYYLIMGNSKMQQNKTDEAEAWFAKAQTLKLPSDNEKAMILIQMIGIHMSKNKWTQANNAYRELKALNYSNDMFRDQIKIIEENLKNQSKVKMMHQMDQRSMFRPGGKRRMPRMR